MRLLLTGGTGFIGSNLVEALGARFDMVAPSSGELDLLDRDAVGAYFGSRRFDAVVHAATWDATRTSSKDASLVYENNLRMFANLARERDSYGRFIHLGSGAAYDRGRDLLGVREDDFGKAVPDDQYGRSKYEIRKECEAREGFVDLCLFGVFGKYEDWRLRFISNACCHAVFDMPLEVRQDCLFDYISVDDVAEAVAWCVLRDLGLPSCNVCSGVPRRLVELAEMVLEVSGKDLPIRVLEAGTGRAYAGDPEVFETVTGWKPSPLSEKVTSLYSWYEEHRKGIDLQSLGRRYWATPSAREQ